MQKAKVQIVLGHLFGDEGKGHVVSDLCLQAKNDGRTPLVVRFSGGPQAGHTVSLNEKGDMRIVFSSFGSGTCWNTPTFLDSGFYVNPVKVKEEYDRLCSMHTVLAFETPYVYCNTSRFITPYDIHFSQADANVLRNGTCGHGVFGAFSRYEKFGESHNFDPRTVTAMQVLESARETYEKAGFDFDDNAIENEIEEFVKAYSWFVSYVSFVDDAKGVSPLEYLAEHYYDTIIFEGSQGLLLDMDNGYFPNVTPSKVGINGITETNLLKGAEVYLVTRAYLTRHGNGYEPTDKLFEMKPLPEEKYETNVYNEFQGVFKKGVLEFRQLEKALQRSEIEWFSKRYSMRLHLVVTHLDVISEAGVFAYKDRFDIGRCVMTESVESICETIKNHYPIKTDALYYTDGPNSALNFFGKD